MTETQNQPRTWIFQYNPRNYELADFIEQEGLVDHWAAKQEQRFMQPEQLVYILRAGGSSGGRSARLEAVGRFDTAVYSDESDPYDPL